MAEASRRAARPARKGGLDNARFVVAAAEAPPDGLAGIAQLVTVQLPWGSLLRGIVGMDALVARGVAGLVGPGGELALLLAPAERDGLDGLPLTTAGLVDAAARAFDPDGFVVIEGRAATAEEVEASGSTWARRLRRAPTLVRLARR